MLIQLHLCVTMPLLTSIRTGWLSYPIPLPLLHVILQIMLLGRGVVGSPLGSLLTTFMLRTLLLLTRRTLWLRRYLRWRPLLLHCTLLVLRPLLLWLVRVWLLARRRLHFRCTHTGLRLSDSLPDTNQL